MTMRIFGKPLSEYVSFCRIFLGLILVVGLVRLALSVGGVPNITARWFSITAVAWLGVFYYAVRVQTSGFGSYKQLLVICALQNLLAQTIAIAGILLAIFTGTGNIFSAPEYAFGADGRTWAHVAAHVFIGIPIGTVVGWVVGSAILAVTRKQIERVHA
jgi:hypothetical protein